MVFPDEIQKFLSALTNKNRQRIMFLFAESAMLTVGEVAARTELGVSTASEHLKLLREAGLLRAEKNGKEVEYRPHVANIQKALQGLGKYLHKCC